MLSGTLDDGTAGLVAVRERGGTTIVQDPDDALYRGMSSSAIAVVGPRHVLPVADIPALLVELAEQHVEPARRRRAPPTTPTTRTTLHDPRTGPAS